MSLPEGHAEGYYEIRFKYWLGGQWQDFTHPYAAPDPRTAVHLLYMDVPECIVQSVHRVDPVPLHAWSDEF